MKLNYFKKVEISLNKIQYNRLEDKSKKYSNKDMTDLIYNNLIVDENKEVDKDIIYDQIEKILEVVKYKEGMNVKNLLKSVELLYEKSYSYKKYKITHDEFVKGLGFLLEEMQIESEDTFNYFYNESRDEFVDEVILFYQKNVIDSENSINNNISVYIMENKDLEKEGLSYLGNFLLIKDLKKKKEIVFNITGNYKVKNNNGENSIVMENNEFEDSFYVDDDYDYSKKEYVSEKEEIKKIDENNNKIRNYVYLFDVFYDINYCDEIMKYVSEKEIEIQKEVKYKEASLIL